MLSMAGPSVRATTVEGIFYPSDPVELESAVRRLLDSARAEPSRPLCIVAPHAALEYAGDVIAEAMKAASDRPVQTVVVLAPIHRDPPEGFVLPESGRFQSPLGDMVVDQMKVDELLGCATSFARNDIPHLEEHSIELLLPFLLHVFPHARLVPILTGRAGRKAVQSLSRALEICFGPVLDRTLFVVSANAATSVPRGAGTASEVDRLLDLVSRRRWAELLEEHDRGTISCCGTRGLASVLAFGNIALTARVLARSSSADVSGKRAVHYAAISLAVDAVAGPRPEG